MPQIPQLDIRRLDTHQDEFLAEFGAAYQEWGFAGIIGHGIETSVIKDALAAAADFFALPEDTKRRYLGLSVDDWSRGYVPFGMEKAKHAQHSDLKEFFHIGRESSTQDHLHPNIWPQEPSNFKPRLSALYQQLDQLGLRILQAVALYLELPRSYFDAVILGGEALLRVLHYPPLTDQDVPNLRAAAHEDINLLTLLVGSEQDGLEVLSRRQEWVPINIIEETIVCNVGDMLQRLSNKKLPSTTHRVVNPKGANASVSRYSIPFFIHPHPSMRLDCLPQCVDASNPAQFAPSSAGEYHQQRLREIGLLK